MRTDFAVRFSVFLALAGYGLHAAPALASKDSVPDWVRAAATQPAVSYSPDTNAVVLLDETTLTVGQDGKAVEHRRHVVKILRPAGRDDGLVHLWFDKDTKILSFHVWSIGPDGHEYAVKDNEIAEIGASSEGGMLYQDVRMRAANPPGRDPGGVIAYEYEQREPYYQHEADWFFQNDIPHLKQSFTIELPSNYTYVTVWAHHDPEKAIDLEHQRYRWEFDATPAIDLHRILMAPRLGALTGRMTVHYGPSGDAALGTWKGVGELYDQMAHDRMAADPEIAAKAAELTAGKTDFYDKTEAIAEFVQKDIRYFVIEKGIGGLQPHAAADIFKNRYGDCKDKSTLLSAMLSTVGIHSAIVLVDSERGFVDPKAPSMLGNHAIAAVRIPDGYDSPRLRSVVTTKHGRYLIVDPTWEKTAFGQIEHNLQGGYAVLVEGQDSEIVEIPVLSPEFNNIHRSASLQLQTDGSLKGNVVEKRFGDLSEHRRALYGGGDAKEQATFLDHSLSHDFVTFSVSDVNVENVQALNKDLTTTFNLSADRYARAAGPLLMVRPRVLGTEGLETDRKPRLLPIDLDQTMQEKDDFTIQLPEGYALDEIPEPVKLDLGFAAYESSTRLDGNTLHYTRTYTVRELTLPANRYADVQKLAETIATDEQSRAVLKRK